MVKFAKLGNNAYMLSLLIHSHLLHRAFNCNVPCVYPQQVDDDIAVDKDKVNGTGRLQVTETRTSPRPAGFATRIKNQGLVTGPARMCL